MQLSSTLNSSCITYKNYPSNRLTGYNMKLQIQYIFLLQKNPYTRKSKDKTMNTNSK